MDVTITNPQKEHIMWIAMWNKQLYAARSRREILRKLGKPIDFRVTDYPSDNQVLVFAPGEYTYGNVISEICEHWTRNHNFQWKMQEAE